jgi:hypothetical protein
MRHDDLLNLVLLELSPFGHVWKNETRGRVMTADGCIRVQGDEGAADILGCIGGRSVAVEVKTGKGGLSTPQRRWRDAFLKAGGAYVEARSVADVEHLKVLAG